MLKKVGMPTYIAPTNRIFKNSRKRKKKHSDTKVIRGGELFIWKMVWITTQLKAEGLPIHIETSGTYKLKGIWDWICLSPKK
jgi:organic radical activating enzyme